MSIYNKVVSSLQNKMLRQSIYTFMLRVFGVIIFFGFMLFITRNYSADRVGEFEFVRMFMLVTGSICLLGTDISILYFSGRFKALDSFHSIRAVYFKMVKLILSIALSILLIYVLVIPQEFINNFFGDTAIYGLLLKCLIFLPVYILTLFNTEMFRAIDKAILAELFRNTFKYIPVIIGGILLFSYRGNFKFVDFYIYGFVVLAAISFILIFYFLNRIKTSNTNENVAVKEIVRLSLPMGVSNVIMYLLLSIDIFILKKYFGNQAVAHYSVALKIITILSMIILSATINISPKISELYNSKKFLELEALCRKTAKIIFSVNVVISILLGLFIKQVLLFFGPEYLAIQNVFFVLLFSQLFCSVFGVVPVYLNMTERSRIFQKILLITLSINTVLNCILIPLYGAMGAAIVFTSSVVFWNICVVIYVYKKDRIKLYFN